MSEDVMEEIRALSEAYHRGFVEALALAASVAEKFTNAGPDDICEHPQIGKFQREIAMAIRQLAL